MLIGLGTLIPDSTGNTGTSGDRSMLKSNITVQDSTMSS